MAEPFVPRWVRCHPDGELREAEGLSCLAEGAHSRLYKRSLIATPSGRLPDDDGTLARYCGLGLATWRKVRAELEAAGLWKRDRNSLFCPRARAELKVCAERYGKAQKAGKTAASKRLQNQEVLSVSSALEQHKSFHKTDGTERTDGTDKTGGRGVDGRDGTDPATRSGIPTSDASTSSPPSVSQTLFSDTPVPFPSVSVPSKPPPADGWSTPGSLLSAGQSVRHVMDVLLLAMQTITGKSPKTLPDEGIARKVIQAANGADSKAIEAVLLRTARKQAPREVEQYAYFVPIVEKEFAKAQGGPA